MVTRRNFIKYQFSLIGGICVASALPLLSGCKDVAFNESEIASLILSPNEIAEKLQSFTDVYKSYNGKQIALREAACNQALWKARVKDILPSDIFAGRVAQAPIGFIAQSDNGELGYYVHIPVLKALIQNPELSTENRSNLEELLSFWKRENTVEKIKAAFTPEMNEALPSDFYSTESGIAFTLWRMSGIQLDFGKLMRLGIPGLKKEINSHLSTCKNQESEELYQAMLIALDTFRDICLYYASRAELLSSKHSGKIKKELKSMASTLEYIADNKPSTLRQALQLMYLYVDVDGTRNYGRMDDYLADIYQNEYEAGAIDEDEAIRLFSGIWSLMADRAYRYDTRLIIGGLGRTNQKWADKVALLIMETSNQVRDIVPQIALRFHKDQDPALYQKGLDVLATGYTFPMLYNDDANIPAVQKAYGVPYEEAIHAIQYGCGEYVLNHRSVGTPSAVINLLQALLVTINYGIDPITGEHQGMPKSRYSKYGKFRSFDSLYNAYCEQVEYHIKQLAQHEELEYIYAGKDNAYLYTSMLMDDCIKRGKGVFSGGVRYLGGTLESYGNTNAADSFTAIKKLVYEGKVFTLDQLRTMLNANFEGYEKERQMLLDIPKYGNDDTNADQMLCKVHDHVCKYTRDQKHNTSLHSYLVVVINNDAHVYMGQHTGASPDGRLANTYLNPGNNPMSGHDKSGVTAFLNSMAKPDISIHAGAVQNMKFSKDFFSENRKLLEMLLSTYFADGGAQAMLTVIDKRDLEEAMKHPENYQNLIVRVGGFSERFVNLPRATQLEILERTLY